MKLRSPWLIWVTGFLIACVIRLAARTMRYRIAGPDAVAHPADPHTARHIYAFWHESILAMVGLKIAIRVLIGRHADGELIAQVCCRLGIQVVRGSTTRGGSTALLELVQGGKAAHMAMTPDGPQGPRRRVQLGVVALASLTGLPIVGFGAGFSRAWRARSWDRFALPRPWSTINLVATPVLRVPASLDRDGLECYRRLLEESLLNATAAAENWAQGGAKPAAEKVGDDDSNLKASA
ncbi:MAG TPA: hypothetical protein DDY78_18395 [Planctomycetales bacterium]|nr:hypothetical protein [Planctomycetales bacterium]